jgi:hypothetical protein
MEQKRKNRLIAIGAVGILVLSILLIAFSFFLNRGIVEKQEIIFSFGVSDKAGIDLNKTILSLGNVIPGGTSLSRGFEITNYHDFPVIADVYAKCNQNADMSKFLDFEKQVKIPSKESYRILVVATAPKGEPYANYTGKIVVVLKKDI